MDEKRNVLRRRTYLAAQLSSRDGIAWAQAVVRNLSDSGALIEALDAPLPDALDIAVPMAGLRRRARVAWRGEGRAGLHFEAPAGRVATAQPAGRRPGDDPNY